MPFPAPPALMQALTNFVNAVKRAYPQGMPKPYHMVAQHAHYISKAKQVLHPNGLKRILDAALVMARTDPQLRGNGQAAVSYLANASQLAGGLHAQYPGQPKGPSAQEVAQYRQQTQPGAPVPGIAQPVALPAGPRAQQPAQQTAQQPAQQPADQAAYEKVQQDAYNKMLAEMGTANADDGMGSNAELIERIKSFCKIASEH